MKKLLKFCNEQHWYIIAAIFGAGLVIWIYGCQSTVTSLIDPQKKITRPELKLETNYILGQAKVKLADLDRQDEIKRIMLEQTALFGTGGTFNPTGLLNTLVSIGAVAFGLNRNQKIKSLTKKTTDTNTV